MTDTTPDDRVLDFVDRYLAFLTDGGDEPDLEALEEPLRSQALQQLRALDLLAAEPYPMPPIEDDPIAKRFGFDRPDQTITLSTATLKDAALALGIPFSELAKKLTAGGRPTESRDLLRLTSSVTANVDRDLAARFAAILKTSVLALEATSQHDAMTLADYLVLEEARLVIDACARELGLPFDDVQRRAREIVGAAVFRNRTNAAWRDALRAALDRIRDERRG